MNLENTTKRIEIQVRTQARTQAKTTPTKPTQATQAKPTWASVASQEPTHSAKDKD